LSDAQFTPKRIRPTDEQVAIQTATQRTVLIEANAGAAKTTTLALRMAESWHRGVAPEKMLALTYTEPACDALRAALAWVGLPAPVIRRFRISTVDAFAAAVLFQLEGAAVPLLARADALRDSVLQAVQQVENNPDERWPEELVFPGSGDAMVEAFLAESLQLKGTMLLDRQDEERRITPELADELGRSYALLKTFRVHEQLRRGGHPDRPAFRAPFDATYDLAQLIAHDAFDNSSPGWPSGLRVLVFDEMHDMNHAMFTVVKRLLDSNHHAFFCGAGDRDQVIHQVAGADARYMTDPLQLGAGRTVQRHPLTASYRFGPRLAGLAGRLARKPYASLSTQDTSVSLRACDDAADGAAQIVQLAREWHDAHGQPAMAGFAVLLRHAHQSVAVENALLEAQLPYVTAGLPSYLLRPEVLLVRGVLAVASDDFSSVQDANTRRRILEAFVFFGDVRITTGDSEPQDQALLMRQAVQAVVENPRMLSVFFDNQVLRNAEPAVRGRLQAAVAVAQQEQGPDALPRLLQALQVRALAARVLVERAQLREVEGNLAGLLASAAGFTSAAAFFASLNEAELRLQRLKRASCLVISSIEAAKGLEFEHVLLPELSHTVFPDGESPLADERNLFYVAITRARRCLTLFVPRGRPPSRFLADTGYL
jgi:DNA helicase-2/ATP-dependent DNA helicase PcrA